MYGPFIMQKKEEGGIPMAGRKPKPTVSHMQDGRKHRSILLPEDLLLRLIKDISSRHLGLELQIPIRS